MNLFMSSLFNLLGEIGFYKIYFIYVFLLNKKSSRNLVNEKMKNGSKLDFK